MKIFRLPVPVLALVALAACEEAAAPEGQPGDLTVAAYVDNDASGSLTTGDSPLADFEVALFRGTQQVATASTGADGRVTFSDLEPDAYRVEPIGPPPAGAALTSNPSPSAVIDFTGGTVTVDFRYAMFPGEITGRVFRDENANGTFEQGVDVPGPGIWVFLRADTGAVGAKLDSVRTDSLGAYRFGLVAQGNYFLEFEQLGAINYGPTGRTRPVAVVAASTATLNMLYTGSIFVTVRQARATPRDETVGIIADVTVPPGRFIIGGTSGTMSEMWVQDTSGGIAVAFVPTADSATFRLGTRVEVVGTIDLFNQQEQIGRSAAPPTVRARTGGTVVAARPNTLPDAHALTDEGELVVVSGVRVKTVPGGTGGAFNVTVVAPNNIDTLVIRVSGIETGLTRASFIVGERYNITGVLTQFQTTAQLKPRFPTDVSQIVVTPVARVIINEFMANPNAVADAVGEYIELHNWGTAAANLQGWTIEDAANVDTIDVSLVIPAGGYVLLGLSSNSVDNGGLTVDFVYQRIALNNTNAGTSGIADTVMLRDPTGALVDSLVFSSSQAAPGTAVGVRDPSADNADARGANWQAQTSTFGTAATPDRGTPRAQNDGYIAPTQPSPLVRKGDGVAPLTTKHR